MDTLNDFLLWAWAVLPPALIGLGLCNLAVTFGHRWFMRQANAQSSA